MMEQKNHWPTQAKPRVLVVDDDTTAVKLLFQLLQHECEMFFALQATEAVSRVQELKPDLIVLDVVMDQLDGYEICTTLKADPQLCDIPVIFITSHFDASDEARGFSCGAVDFIHKPINPLVTLARIRTQLKLKEQADFLRRLSMVDGLTGLANRRHFDSQLQAEWRRCVRLKRPLALALIDIDWFKQFNDCYGHLTGDDCIRAVAQLLQRRCSRPSDLAVRYGGEEFVLLWPDTELAGAMHLLEELMQQVAQSAIPHERSQFGIVSLSIGLCCGVPHDSMTALQWLEHADQLLYQAKQQGRRQICSDTLQAPAQALPPATEPVRPPVSFSNPSGESHADEPVGNGC